MISNSMLRSLCACSTQAWLRSSGYAVSDQENKRTRAGRDAHLAFEAWLKGAPGDAAVEQFQASYREYSDHYLLDSDSYSIGNLSRVLSVFINANPLPAMPFEVVETEHQVEYEVWNDGGTRYVVTDKSDGIVRMKDTGDLFAIEHKTTGHIGEGVASDYALDSQITTHVAACRGNGRDVKGVVLQVLQFNKLPDPLATTPKTGKPLSCRTSGHGYQRDCWTQHVRWERFTLTRTESQINTWIANTVPLLVRYGRLLEQGLLDAPQEGLFGKCGSCEFLPFCLSERRNWDMLTVREREPGVLYSGVYE